MAEHSTVGIYDTMAQAEEAVHTLDQAGFPVKHISIVTQSLASNTTLHGYIAPPGKFESERLCSDKRLSM
jgi:hypothetical protein